MYHVVIQATHPGINHGEDRLRTMTTTSDFTIPDENLIAELEREVGLIQQYNNGQVTAITVTHKKGF